MCFTKIISKLYYVKVYFVKNGIQEKIERKKNQKSIVFLDCYLASALKFDIKYKENLKAMKLSLFLYEFWGNFLSFKSF